MMMAAAGVGVGVGQCRKHVQVEAGVVQGPAALALVERRGSLGFAEHELLQAEAGVRLEFGLADRLLRLVAPRDQVDVDLVVPVIVTGDGAQSHRSLRVDEPVVRVGIPVPGERPGDRGIAGDGEVAFGRCDVELADAGAEQFVERLRGEAGHAAVSFLVRSGVYGPRRCEANSVAYVGQKSLL